MAVVPSTTVASRTRLGPGGPAGNRRTGGVRTLQELQRSAGNRAVSLLVPRLPAVGPVHPLVLQRALNPPGSANAGRLPAAEKAGAKAVLRNNGFTATDVLKVWAEEVQQERLALLFTQVHDTDAEIDQWGGSTNHAQRKRKQLKKTLEAQYDDLLAYAERCRADADDTFERTVLKAVEAVAAARTETGKMFKPEENLWRPKVTQWFYGAHIGFVTSTAFEDAVIKLFKQRQASPQIAAGLSDADKQMLATEKAAINAQLTAWNTKPDNAPGCNENGTWGTSFGGVGHSWQVRRVSAPVWNKLRVWWLKKAGAYITPSDTTDRSLKMRRTPVAGLSPVLNYHIDIAS